MFVRTYGRRSRCGGGGGAAGDFDLIGGGDSCPSPSAAADSDADDPFPFPFSSQSQSQELLPTPLLPFSSQESSPWDLDDDLFPAAPPPPKRRLRAGELAAATASTATATLMEAQEFGEMMEHVDEVNFALDGLRQPLRRVRRASLLTLLSICGAARHRRLLRAQGLAKRIVDAVMLMKNDDAPCSIAAATLFFVLASDVQDDHLLDSPTCIKFLLKLLNPLLDAVEEKTMSIGSKFIGISKTQKLSSLNSDSDHSSDKITSKVCKILQSCKEVKWANSGDAKTKRPELSSKWIALLTIEKACLSAVSMEDTCEMVRKVGGNFKERLRQLGGLDTIFDIMASCHSDLERSVIDPMPSFLDITESAALESVVILLKCLKIMENATFLSEENQNHLLKMHKKSSAHAPTLSFVGLVIRSIKLLSDLALRQNSSSNDSKKESKSFDDVDMEDCAAGTNLNIIIDLVSDENNSSMSNKHQKQSHATRETRRNSETAYVSEACYSGRVTCPSTSVSTASTSSFDQKHSNGGLKRKLGIVGARFSSIGGSREKVPTKADSFRRNSVKRTEQAGASRDGQHCLMTDSADPFDFDEDDLGPSKWELLTNKHEAREGDDSQTMDTSKQKSDDVFDDIAAVMDQSSQYLDEGSNKNNYKSSESAADEDSSVVEDCLLTSIKVLMNLTNDNPRGCEQIALHGGLDAMALVIARHFPSFYLHSHLNSQAQGKKFSTGAVLPSKNNSCRNGALQENKKKLKEHELDLLVSVLGLLVNLVEKDSRNRVRLASARVTIDQPGIWGRDDTQRDVIPLLCSIFLANQSCSETTRVISLDDEDSMLQGEREAEMMIVEAYSALLLAFLSTESTKVRESIASCLPNNSLKILVPVLERFVAFHLSLNMISPESHSAVTRVIKLCGQS